MEECYVCISIERVTPIPMKQNIDEERVDSILSSKSKRVLKVNRHFNSFILSIVKHFDL